MARSWATTALVLLEATISWHRLVELDSSAPAPYALDRMTAAELNRSQRDAVSTRSGPLLVLAGAGTGKTRVITYRIAELIRHGTPPSRILAVTFTNKAAREMRERALSLLGRRKRGQKVPEISTFHSLCVRVLRRHCERLGYPKGFTIYDRGDQESVVRTALRDIRVGSSRLKPSDVIALVGAWKTHGVDADRAAQNADGDRQELGAAAYARYQASLRASGAMDFDDLLLLTEELFERFPDVRVAEATRFDHLLIDEYQDTNGLQYRIVKALADRHRNLCVVGDDDQSIYGWRGAEVAHILSFQRDWPDARVVRLEDNYRSRAPILTLANTLISHNSERHPKELRAARGEGPPPRFIRFEDETSEAEALVREIARLIEPGRPERISPSDIAILFRTNEQPRAFELELRRARVPYLLVGGLSFYDRKEVRDLMGYLRVLVHPQDEVSLLRIINTPSRGISTASVQILIEKAVHAGKPLWSTLPDAGTSGELSHHVAERVQGFVRLIDEFRARLGSTPLTQLANELLERIGYRAELERLYGAAGEAEGRWEAVEELVNSIALYEQRAEDPSLIGFLDEAALAARDGKSDDPEERRPHAVTLMTLHSAKGLEFPHVYLVGMEEGLLPHKRSVVDGGIAEERRLCYVGVTRAQDTLTLSYCKARMKWGKAHPSIPSRFLMEMRGDTERARRAAEAAHKVFCSPALAPSEAAAAEPRTEPQNEATLKRRARGRVESASRSRRRALP